MFIDETEITVSSGRGGDGVVSFRRERYVPKGGPDGGDGGHGGSVILKASGHLSTLAGIQHRRHYKASPGKAGGANNCFGKRGEDLLIEVPVGTIVRDAERGHVLRDLDHDGLEVAVVTGGRGGRGNKHFAHATNQTPRQSTIGMPGETRRLRLELRLVADVGLVGLPNAGKSTFLRRVSAARPKVAEYPFTTLEPMLGIAEVDEDQLVIADIPGLIEGAHEGSGLGDRFLRHIARTRVLMHLVDAAAGVEEVVPAWRTIREELTRAGLGLEDKHVLVVASRADTVEDPSEICAALAAACGSEVLPLSSQTGAGVPEVLRRLAELVADAGREPETGKAGGTEPSKP
jgi:GTP-binding protein